MSMSLIPEVQSIDFDDLEKGYLRAYPQNYFSPYGSTEEMRTTLLEVNKQKTSCKLKEDPSLEFLLEAHLNQKTQVWEIFQYNLRTRRQKDLHPIAYLKSQSKGKWALWSSSCEHCDNNYHFNCTDSATQQEMREQLMLIESNVQDLSDSIMYTLNIIMPTVDEANRKKTWCPRKYPHANDYNSDNFLIKDFEKRKSPRAAVEEDSLSLTTVSPQWDEGLQSFCIDFGGRIQRNSKRNFQIQKSDDPQSNVLCQFGKKDQGLYILDYKSPLSLIQALGVALVSLQWE